MNGFGEIRQLGYLCRDIETSMQRWIDKAELGPFIWYKNLSLPMVYQGEPSTVQMHVAIAYRGDLQIELIEQLNDAPSPYKTFFDKNRMGLHHIAYVTDDMDAALQAAGDKGYEIIATIDAVVGRYAYFQDPAMPETLYEFLELTPDIENYWKDCIARAKDWDGSEPVTVLDMAGV